MILLSSSITRIVYMQDQIWILMFFVVPIITAYWYLRRFQKKNLENFTGQQKTSMNSSSLFFQMDRPRFWLRVFTVACAWIFISISLMQPTARIEENTPAPPTVQNQNDQRVDEVAFFLDVSASMAVQDINQGNSRLARAKELIHDMVDNLGGINISLSLFAGDTLLVVPPTMDYLYFLLLLDRVAINQTSVAGTDFLSLIKGIQERYMAAHFHKNIVAILLSDGEDTTMMGMNSTTKQKATDVLSTSLQLLAHDGYRLNVVGVGNRKGGIIPNIAFEGKPVSSSVQPEFLITIAEQGGGSCYFEGETASRQIIDSLTTKLLDQSQFTIGDEVSETHLFYYPVLIAIFFLSISLLLDRRVSYV